MKFPTLGAMLALAGLAAGAGAFHLQQVDAPRSDQAAELKSLKREYRAAQRAQREAYQAATTPAEQAAALKPSPWEPVAGRFLALAEAAEGTEVAAGCWSEIYAGEHSYGDAEKAWTAFEILVYDHTNSEELEPVLQDVSYRRKSDRLLDGLHHVLETTTRESLEAGALFGLAKLLEGDESTRDEAFGYYERIVAEFPDVNGGRGQTYGARAEGALFEARHLQIGMQVPDMEAVDETGTSFKLSDYRGKVVLVDFWGFW